MRAPGVAAMMKSVTPFAATLLLAACVPGANVPLPVTGGRTFDPIAFFAGHTEGTGTLKITFKAARRVRVHGIGRVEGDTLTLDQTVESDGARDEHRTWRIERTPAGDTGALSDAVGPVAIEVTGSRLHLRYRSKKDGLGVEQWLDLSADGRRADNILLFRKFGLRVARLGEAIHKTD